MLLKEVGVKKAMTVVLWTRETVCDFFFASEQNKADLVNMYRILVSSTSPCSCGLREQKEKDFLMSTCIAIVKEIITVFVPT